VSVVYLAEDQRLKRRVALKLLAPALASDERFRKRFLRESELAASLDHANVIPIYEAGEADGSLFIAMRYVEGSDVKTLIREGPLSPERAVVLTAQVAGGLDAAHRRGLVHGDVKPSNVLIDSDDHAYLADFGLTRRLADPRLPGGEAQLMGTIDYVAPEQIRAEEVDGRADVYSLGCVLYECLTGRQPFRRGNDAATLYAHLAEDPPPTGTPADPVLAKALAKIPGERYATCTELAEAARLALGVATPRRSRLPLVVAVVAALVAAGALAAFLVTRGGAAHVGTTGRLVRIDAATNEVGKPVRVGNDPTGVAVDGLNVWLTTRGSPSLWRVESDTGQVTPVAADGPLLGIASRPGLGYVLDGAGGVERFDLNNGERLPGTIKTEAEVIGAGPPGVWVAGPNDVLRIGSVTPTVGAVLASVRIPNPARLDETNFGADVTGIAVEDFNLTGSGPFGEQAIWITGDADRQRLFRLASPGRQRDMAAFRLPFVPSGVAAAFGSVWVTAQLDDLVARIDPATGKVVRTIKVGREPLGLALSEGAVWVANALDGTITRIDPAKSRVTATIRLGATPRAITADGAAVWVAIDEG